MWRKHGNRVQRTRFPCTETEFIELVFHVWNSFSMNSAPMGFASERSWSDVFISLNSAHMGLLDRLVQKIVGCVCRSCKELVFYTWKTSSMNSFANNLTLWAWSDKDIWSRPFWSKPMGAKFMENEFNELGFCTWKPSSLNSISMFSPHRFS